jgi:protein-L-isoaspartate(D-aspartate) O-methyltransferase
MSPPDPALPGGAGCGITWATLPNQRVPPVADYETRRIMMVDTQVRPSDVTRFPIIQAMLEVPRELYVPPARREAAYVGEHVALAPGRVILDPRTFAKLLDALDVTPRDVVLDIGCGMGYSAAVIAQLAEFVVGVEDDPARAEEAQAILSENGVDNAAVVAGALAEGAPRSGPYDAVMIEGGVECLPEAIAAQIKEGGRIACIWAEGALGTARVGVKTDGRISWRFAFNAAAPVLPGFEKERSFAL